MPEWTPADAMRDMLRTLNTVQPSIRFEPIPELPAWDEPVTITPPPRPQRNHNQCSDCGESLGWDYYHGGNNERYCVRCYRRMPSCTNCGAHNANVEDLNTDPDERLCPSCLRNYARECALCGQRTANQFYFAPEETTHVCVRCARDLPRCPECDRRMAPDAPRDRQCGECARNYVRRRVYDYTYKPRPIFHGRGPTYLGWELEVSTPWTANAITAMDLAHTHEDLFYPKYDSSIVGGGFELVTHPMSYSWAMSRFPWDLLPQLAELDCSGEGNGLHVHVARQAFSSPAHLYSWLALYYRNASRVETIARRRSYEWAPFNPDDRVRMKSYAKQEMSADRHRAINTENRDTLEVRVFASSLVPEQVQAALGLVHASVAYTRQLTSHDVAVNRGWDWGPFMDWCAQRNRYAPLTSEWERLGR